MVMMSWVVVLRFHVESVPGIRMMLEDETQGGGSVLRVTYLRGFEYWTPTKVTKLGAKL